MTKFNSGVPVNSQDELSLLYVAKEKCLKAMAKGTMLVAEIEIRGRVIKHLDPTAAYKQICGLIHDEESRRAGRNPGVNHARSRAILRR
jgi:hypothetical protein